MFLCPAEGVGGAERYKAYFCYPHGKELSTLTMKSYIDYSANYLTQKIGEALNGEVDENVLSVEERKDIAAKKNTMNSY